MKIDYTKNFSMYNKQDAQWNFYLHMYITLEYFNFKRQNELGDAKGLLSTFIASSVITAAKWLLEEINPMHSWIFAITDSFSSLLNLWVHS